MHLNSKFSLAVIAASLCLPLAAESQPARARPGAGRTAAARPATARPGASRGPQVSTAQISAYLNRLRGKLTNAWMLPDGNNHVTVTGNFNQDGLSDNLKSSSNPKNGSAEDCAMQAFNKCMPLEALPGGLANAKVTVDFTSNADPHGDSKSNISLRLDPVKTEAPKTEAAQSQATPAATNSEPAQAQTAPAAPAVTTAPAATTAEPAATTANPAASAAPAGAAADPVK